MCKVNRREFLATGSRAGVHYSRACGASLQDSEGKVSVRLREHRFVMPCKSGILRLDSTGPRVTSSPATTSYPIQTQRGKFVE